MTPKQKKKKGFKQGGNVLKIPASCLHELHWFFFKITGVGKFNKNDQNPNLHKIFSGILTKPPLLANYAVIFCKFTDAGT